jgi:hypothetical protein
MILHFDLYAHVIEKTIVPAICAGMILSGGFHD